MLLPVRLGTQRLGQRFKRQGLSALYDTISEFLRDLNAAHSLRWSLLVMGVVVGTSLCLFIIWEAVLRAAGHGRRWMKRGGRWMKQGGRGAR